jgi:hypothetical protein
MATFRFITVGGAGDRPADCNKPGLAGERNSNPRATRMVALQSCISLCILSQC